jgi:hypothetical protein
VLLNKYVRVTESNVAHIFASFRLGSGSVNTTREKRSTQALHVALGVWQDKCSTGEAVFNAVRLLQL